MLMCTDGLIISGPFFFPPLLLLVVCREKEEGNSYSQFNFFSPSHQKIVWIGKRLLALLLFSLALEFLGFKVSCRVLKKLQET